MKVFQDYVNDAKIPRQLAEQVFNYLYYCPTVGDSSIVGAAEYDNCLGIMIFNLPDTNSFRIMLIDPGDTLSTQDIIVRGSLPWEDYRKLAAAITYLYPLRGD